jgi:hypothetical protein
LEKWIVFLSRMNPLRSATLSIVTTLGLLAVPAPVQAQATSAEKNSPVADAPSRDDAATLQKKPMKPKPGFTETKTTATSL